MKMGFLGLNSSQRSTVESSDGWDLWLVLPFLCKDLAHHPIETTNQKWMFQVPGGNIVQMVMSHTRKFMTVPKEIKKHASTCSP